MTIDFHTHCFPQKIASRALEQMSLGSNTRYFTDGTEDGLVDSMRQAGVGLSVNLPVMTSPGQVEKVNDALIAQADAMLARGVLTFGGVLTIAVTFIIVKNSPAFLGRTRQLLKL